jgi:2-polyprenyl-6-methoxyphenol hydroxylase-like FAD-dependent oxidoreductase
MRVLISGAGIAGPALAWFLEKAGARVTVIDKAPAILPHGQSIDLQGSARVVVAKMGLKEEIMRRKSPEAGTQFIDPQGRAFGPMPAERDVTAASFTSEYEILRGDLAKIFYEATKDHPNTTYRFATSVDKILANDDESVSVQLSNGEIQEYDLLVAADGQWSKVRKQVFSPDELKVIDRGMYAVYYTIPRLPQDNDWWNIYQALGSRVITTRPDRYGATRVMFCRFPRNAADTRLWQDASRSDRKTQQEVLRREFADAGWDTQRFLDGMDQAPDWYFHVIQQIKMKKWSRGRIICLGDTAYAPSPLTGMGTSLAILGAYLLGGELSKLRPGEHPSKAFDAYEDMFHPFVEQAQDIPSWVPGIGFAETEWRRFWMRCLLRTMAWIARMPWFAKRSVESTNAEDFKLPVYPTFEHESDAVSESKGGMRH